MAKEIDYNMVTKESGHQSNKKVNIVDAANELFRATKTKNMQVAVSGSFITFETVDELEEKLSSAADSGFNITCYDEVIGG